MKITTDQITQYFQESSSFRQVHYASYPGNPNSQCELIGHLNPIRPFKIHIVGKDELAYLSALDPDTQFDFIEQLSSNHASFLILEKSLETPKFLFRQHKLRIMESKFSHSELKQQIAEELTEKFAERASLHGTFVAVFGKGILVMGNCGVGKSSLLVSLLSKGHLWIADDSPLFYLSSSNQIVGHAPEILSEFVHIKGIGPINLDQMYGRACRLPSHPLAGVVHLSNNTDIENKDISAYTQDDRFNLFDRKFPRWNFSSSQSNLCDLVECCAKNLILKDWKYNSADGLENALTNALTD